MLIVIDACSIINLANSGKMLEVVSSPNLKIGVGPQVIGECGTTITELNLALGSNLIIELDDRSLDAGEFTRLMSKYNLGPGETECLQFVLNAKDDILCTDDRAARRAATAEIGAKRILGTLGLLKRAVLVGMITTQDAELAYVAMKAKGAFLPAIAPGFFAPTPAPTEGQQDSEST